MTKEYRTQTTVFADVDVMRRLDSLDGKRSDHIRQALKEYVDKYAPEGEPEPPKRKKQLIPKEYDEALVPALEALMGPKSQEGALAPPDQLESSEIDEVRSAEQEFLRRKLEEHGKG